MDACDGVFNDYTRYRRAKNQLRNESSVKKCYFI